MLKLTILEPDGFQCHPFTTGWSVVAAEQIGHRVLVQEAQDDTRNVSDCKSQPRMVRRNQFKLLTALKTNKFLGIGIKYPEHECHASVEYLTCISVPSGSKLGHCGY